MPRYPVLPDHVREALDNIVPSGNDELLYFPCRVTLRGGEVLDTVYIEPEQPYLRSWGVYPEDDRGKRSVRIDDVVKVEESPTRLPARFANQIYDHGESGMGYTIFTVVFSDGERQACVTGNAVDFIQYPNGKGPDDVAAVLPHEGRGARKVQAPHWYWCLYSGEPFRPMRTAAQVSGGLGSIAETLTLKNHTILDPDHWRILKRRLDNLVRDGLARKISPPAGVDDGVYEWYLDVATGDIYSYGSPNPPTLPEWRKLTLQEVAPPGRQVRDSVN